MITFVKDRPGHDRRYAIDAGEDPARARLDAARRRSRPGCERTVRWYLDNGAWLAGVTSGDYQKWISLNYDGRAAWRAARGSPMSAGPTR